VITGHCHGGDQLADPLSEPDGPGQVGVGQQREELLPADDAASVMWRMMAR
jgi:hypothetical protein